MNSEFIIDNFTVLPKFVGTWRGEWSCFDYRAKLNKKFIATLTQSIVNNRWEQKNVNTYENGETDIWYFSGYPISSNSLSLQSPTHPYNKFGMQITEIENDLVLLDVWDKRTKNRLAIETIYLVNGNHRARTMHQFDANNNLRGFMLINEYKIE